jgi:putative ATPase
MSDQFVPRKSSTPLAARVRPQSLSSFVGHAALRKSGSALNLLLSNPDSAKSIIISGPPGSGKTTLALLIAKQQDAHFVELSAVNAGVKEVREVIEESRRLKLGYSRATYLFIDEIHRFSKTQQDALLPAVEAGDVHLIAATTENPSFSVISPLLSRTIQIRFEPLTTSDIEAILISAIEDERGLAGKISVLPETLSKIAELSSGDARKALTILETVVDAHPDQALISDHELSTIIDSALMRYDRDGDEHYDTISAFIKSVRGSDVDAAIFYLAKMLHGGEDPRFIARRLIILASEDVGLADPEALPLAIATADAVEKIGMPEGRIPLAQCAAYLALAPKSNAAYRAINSALARVEQGGNFTTPRPLRSSNYRGAKDAGNGVGYRYPHDFNPPVIPQKYLPAELEGIQFIELGSQGDEVRLKKLYDSLRQILDA